MPFLLATMRFFLQKLQFQQTLFSFYFHISCFLSNLQVSCTFSSSTLDTGLVHNTPIVGAIQNLNINNGVVIPSNQSYFEVFNKDSNGDRLSYDQIRSLMTFSTRCAVLIKFRCKDYDTFTMFGWQGYSGANYSASDVMGGGICDYGGQSIWFLAITVNINAHDA